jgi:hypothetical protein
LYAEQLLSRSHDHSFSSFQLPSFVSSVAGTIFLGQIWDMSDPASSAPSAAQSAASASSVPALTGSAAPVPAKYSKRKRFEHEGLLIYEWEQDIEQVDMFIQPPPGVTAKMINCVISEKHLVVGIKGNPPFIDVSGPKRKRNTTCFLQSCG